MTSNLMNSHPETKKIESIKAKARLIVNVTEDILVYMEDHNISRSDLANRLGKSRAYISCLFNDKRNITLNTLSDICFAIGLRPEILFVNKNKKPVNYNIFRHDFMKIDENNLWTDSKSEPNANVIDFGKEKIKRKRKDMITSTMFFAERGSPRYAEQ